ncbi:hypothetical protein F4X73_05015 [Candidatus Poribacteria bacterium]|nr:hypothetical protein [Candidatus Poribacteria bacterium]MYF54465.1 hypothetical protein [Candidatus Poribacteria bacterium]
MRTVVRHGLATIIDTTIAKQKSFLYSIYGVFADRATLYIGQTIGKTGALGRLAQHLSDAHGNTYCQRLSHLFHYEEVELERTDLVAVRFANERIFEIDSPVYREAVEDLVQRILINWVTEQELAICIVSRTRPNSYNKLENIQKEASRISKVLEPWILECHQ